MYKILDSDFMLEIKDPKGDSAVLTWREVIVFPQDNAVAIPGRAQGFLGRVYLSQESDRTAAAAAVKPGPTPEFLHT